MGRGDIPPPGKLGGRPPPWKIGEPSPPLENVREQKKRAGTF